MNMARGALPILLWALSLVPAMAFAEVRTEYVHPRYLPPADLADVLGARPDGGRWSIEWRDAAGVHAVQVRRNDAANLLMLSGEAADVAAVQALITAADVAPSQIAIEAKIIEVDENKALAAGIDWGRLRTSASFNQRFTEEHSTQAYPLPIDPIRRRSNALQDYASVDLVDALKMLEEKGAATLRNAPRILTLNNRRASILDGSRTTYVTRYSSYTNLFATDSMDAGLKLSVQPSLGQSGYLTLDIRAELTSIVSNLSGSPVKDGQIVENTVIAKDGETVLLGGFTRTEESKTHRLFPVLGYALPFLFSREETVRTRREGYVAITAHVVPLDAKLDDATRGVIEDRSR